MSHKDIFFGEKSRHPLLKGVNTLADAVRVTMGPGGRCVCFERSFGSPIVTKDGATVAKEVELTDKQENLGANMVRKVASKTADVAGDGTTTATVLAQSIFAEGLKLVAAGHNPMSLKKGIEKACEIAVKKIEEKARPVSTREEISHVATLSANSDEEIGSIIADAIEKAQKDGVIQVEEAKGMETYLEFVEGMQFDRGYLSNYFVTDTEKMEVNFDDSYLLFFDKKITGLKELVPILEQALKTGKPLTIIAEDIEGDALAALVLNRLRANLKIAAVKAPGFGDRRKELLEDLAVLTGGKVISEDVGLKLENATLEDLGQAKKIRIDKDRTIITKGSGDKSALENRIKNLRNQLKETTSDYDKEKLQERIAKLSNGVAVIHVGAVTESELKERKARVDDALSATRAAVESGVVLGGGVTYLHIQKELENAKNVSPEEQFGFEIVKKALEAPLRQIVQNSGLAESSVVVQKIRQAKDNLGFNARTGVYEDLFKAGIMDPAKVAITALQNSVSVSALLLTTECTIVDSPKKDKNIKENADWSE
jgi:chaperonin GroEL